MLSTCTLCWCALRDGKRDRKLHYVYTVATCTCTYHKLVVVIPILYVQAFFSHLIVFSSSVQWEGEHQTYMFEMMGIHMHMPALSITVVTWLGVL